MIGYSKFELYSNKKLSLNKNLLFKTEVVGLVGLGTKTMCPTN
jgi:hypothetical protein